MEKDNTTEVMASNCPHTHPDNFSVAFLLEILNGTSDPIFVKDRQHRWVLLNDAFCSFIGVAPEELIGKSDYDFFPKAQADVFWEKDELVFTTGITNVNEEDFTDAQGETHVISTKKCLFEDEAGNKFLVGTIRDITETITKYRQVEAELRSSKQLLQLVMDNIPQAIFWKDRDSVYQGCNRKFATVAGVDLPENIVGKTDYDLAWKKEEADFFRECDRSVIKSDKAEYGIIEPLLSADGKQCWLETNKIPLHDDLGNVVGILGTFEDITARQEAKAALAESETKYRDLVEASQDLIWSVDVFGRFTFVNQAVKDIYGYEKEEMINRHFNEFQPPEQAQKDQEVFQQIVAGKSVLQYEAVHLAKDGRRINLLFNAIVRRDDKGNVIAVTGTASNITQIKEAEEALMLYKQAVESSSDGIGIADANGIHIYQNPAFGKLYECETVDEFIQFGGIGGVITDSAIAQEIWQTTISLQSWSGEVEHRQSSGRIIQTFVRSYPIKDFTGKCIGFVAAITDITQRKQAEEKLREQEQFLRSVYQGSENPIYVIDVVEGDFRHAGYNCAAERVTGKTSAAVVGKTPEEWINPVAGAAVRQKFVKCLEAGKSISHEECLPLGGQQSWWLTTLNPVKDSAGKIYRIVGTSINITDRKLAETQLQQQRQDLETALQELQRTQMQLVQSEKMSSLGQLVAGVAHEINNPTSFIYGNLTYANDYTKDLLELLQLYQQHYPNPVLEVQTFAQEIELDFLIEDLPKLLNSMKVGANRIKEIVTSLRTFSRMDEAEMKAVDIHEGIDSTLMILQQRLRANGSRPAIEVIKEYGELPLVECYAGQLNQVFMNILSNAIDALEESFGDRKNIRISTELFEQNQVTITITDSGTGIPEHLKQRLFDPFFTTKPIGKGTGMGLSISYQIITQKHGGSLQCVSPPGGGAEFVITIPLRQS